MKNLSVWIVLLVALSVGGISAVHLKGVEESDRRLSHLQPIYERQPVIDSMTLALEKYRRASSNFRKLEPAEMAATKSQLRTFFSKSIAGLDQLESTPDERKLTAKLDEQLNHFLEASAKIEPMLFLKDAYHDPGIVDMHEGMIKTLSQLNKSARSRVDSIGSSFKGDDTGAMRMITGISILIVLLVLLIPFRDYISFMRPLKRLRQYASKLRDEKGTPQARPALKNSYGDVESVLHELAMTVDSQRKDRHKFIQDIVDDLSAPLAMLKKGRTLSSQDADEATQHSAADSVRRGLALLSGSLDDLGDILNLNRLEASLDERVVDLTELVTDTVRELTGGAIGKAISVQAPPMPVWVLVDAKRLERVIVQILSKVAGYGAQRASRLQVSISQPVQGGFRGVELIVQEIDQAGTGPRLSGPEQDLIRHWIAENGFGMALIHKIVKAHGGTITVSGVAGSTVQFRLRLPQNRIGSGLLSPTQKGAQGEMAQHSQQPEAQKLGFEVSPLTHAPFVSNDDSKGPQAIRGGMAGSGRPPRSIG